MAINLTEGNPAKQIVRFAIPMLIGNIFQQLYNMVDSIIVGRFAGADALAAVGSAFPTFFLMLSIAIGLSIGISIILSQYFGAKKLVELRASFANSIILIAVVSVGVTIIGLLVVDPLLTATNTPAETFEMSKQYLSVMFGGMIFTFYFNAFSSVLRAIGDSKTPLYFLMIATVINIILDIVFVRNFGLAAMGVAIATIIAQAVSAILCIIYIYLKVPVLRPQKGDFKIRKDEIAKMLKYGIPTAIQQSFVSVGMILIQGLVNSFGTVFMASYTAATKVDAFAMMPLLNISLAMSTFTGQNIGVGNIKRITKAVKTIMLGVLAFTVVMGALIVMFGPYLITIFIDPADPNAAQIISYGTEFLQTVAFMYIIFGVSQTLLGVLRGAGDVNFTFLSSATVIFVRAPAAYILAATALDYRGVFYSIGIGWLAAAALHFFRYKSGAWKTKSVFGKNVIKDKEKEIVQSE